MQLGECPKDCWSVLNELHEAMEVRVEVEEELGHTELVSNVQLNAHLREDTEEVSWQTFPVSCVWVVN